MNNIYRIVWNAATSTWVAVAENACGRGKGSGRKIAAAALSLALVSGFVQAAPAGVAVASGAGTVSQAGAVTTIKQATSNLSLNWNSFNIGKTETVNFVQPSTSAVAVNRILDTNASQILGRINANGQVYLINPNGILFGQGSVVNVGGLFASSTGVNANITNKGSLIANGGGSIKLEAASVFNTGVIQAQTVGTQQGSIILLGNMSTGTVSVGGTLDASAPNGGNGGFIETSAAHVKFVPGFHISTSAKTGKTGTWLIDPFDFTIAASGGDLTGAEVGLALTGSNLTIQSSMGGSGVLGDINVNDVVTWDKNTLILKADNNININANMTGSGSAKLSLVYGQSTAAGTGSSYILKPLNTWPHGDRVANNTFQAVVSLPAGDNFSTTLGNTGVPVVYTVITNLGVEGDAVVAPTVTSLQSVALPINVPRNFVLGANIDALDTKNWNASPVGNKGFTPIGNTSVRYSGTFDGLGHTISDLYIDMGVVADVGLFGFIVTNPLIQNVGLVRGSVSGGAQTGGLVGNKQAGYVRNSFNTGDVSGGAATGGLVGQNTLGDVVNSYSTGKVNGAAYTGGLVGSNGIGNVSYSYSTGNVIGLVPVPLPNLVRIGSAGVGGLVGTLTTGGVDHSFATGNVSGAAGSGGLVGTITTGVLSFTYANGNVTGGAGTGGLVGTSTGTVELSFATGNVTSTIEGVPGALGGAGAGGLIGQTTGSVNTSFATGNVSGDAGVGGLVGNATDALITNVYATGNVTGNTIVGGLLGSSTGPLLNTYASGFVTGADSATTGGLVGAPTGANTSKNFYNSTVNSLVPGAGSAGSITGVFGLSTQTLTTAQPFVTAGWDTVKTWALIPGINPQLVPLFGIGNTVPTAPPTFAPTLAPTAAPTFAPTLAPTAAPTFAPTLAPTATPTFAPTLAPTAAPTFAPTAPPTFAPTLAPTAAPTLAPTLAPTAAPTFAPTAPPTAAPTFAPTLAPTAAPTFAPTAPPTAAPTFAPTLAPTAAPTASPTLAPTAAPTASPTLAPTAAPTASPTLAPTESTKSDHEKPIESASASVSELSSRSCLIALTEDQLQPVIPTSRHRSTQGSKNCLFWEPDQTVVATKT